MDGMKLDLSGLKDKVASKLSGEKGNKKKDQKQKGNQQKDTRASKPDQQKFDNKNKGKKFEKTNTNKNVASRATNGKQADEKEEDVLRREALELGATEEDLKLLEGLSDGETSEQEFDNDASVDKGFSDDLSKFMKDIGFSNSGPVVVDDDELSEEEVEEEDEEEEEAEEVEEQDSEPQEQEDEDISDEDQDIEDDDEPQQQKQQPLKKEELPTHQKVDPTTILNTSKFLLPPQIDWYNIPLDLNIQADKLTQDQIDRLYQRGKEALETDNKNYYDEFSKTSSQRKFLSQILSDGTLNDKISALTLLIQEAPLHNIKSFDTLMGFMNKKSRNSVLQSLNALKDLFVSGLLPDRKLRHFKQQPLNMMLSKKHLALFYFEDYLKTYYFNILKVLEKLSHDPIIHVRMNVVSHIFDLLKAKPEQEVNLLRLGVNKIGDIDKKVTSKTSYQILQLEQAHPNMKKIVIDAVIDAMFKKNTDYHTKYYSVLTLNQTILTRREEEIANDLVKTYFALFEKLLIESDPHNGENTKADDKDGKKDNYKNRKKNFKKGKKGGKSVKNIKTDEEVIEEKNAKLFSALLTGVNRAFPFSNLPGEVYTKHLDVMFRITHSSNFNTSVQALVLIHQITSVQSINSDRFYRTLYESLLDSRLVTSSKQGIYLNLLFKALKSDSNLGRVMAFVKRIIQVCFNWTNVGAVAGMFYLLMELEKAVPAVRNLAINTPVDHKYVEDDDDEEHFVDVKSDDEDGETKSTQVEKKQDDTEYDGRKRDPRFANASNSSIWEIEEFLNHYHPTVQLYAQSFMDQQKQVKPDLGLFTLAHFLDRFVYRNAKSKPVTKGSSIMQPLGGSHTGSLLVKASNVMNHEIPANTENWLEKRVEEIRPDERFFYEYFTSKEKDPSKLNEPQEDDFDGESDLDDDEVWNALVKSQPDIEGDDEESDLDDLSDLDMDDFSDDDEVEAEAASGEELADGDEADELAADDLSDNDDGSEVELQTIGMSDEEFESAAEEPDFAGFSESEDEEAELFKGDSEDEISDDEEPEQPQPKGKKRSAGDDEEKSKKKSKKAKMKELPLFADADAYAQYLNSDDEN